MLTRDSLPLVVVAHPDPGTADAIRHAVESTGDWRAATAGAGRDALAAVLAGGAVVAIVGCGRLGDLAPGNSVPVLAIGDPDRPADLAAATDAAAEGLLQWPDGAADLAGELARLAGPGLVTEASASARGVVIAVAGVQGGAGTTTLAAHLAGAWARWGAGPVLLADIAGGLGFRLDLSPTTPTWVAVAAHADRLDGLALAGTLASPWPGLSVLPLPGLADGAPEPRPSADLVRTILSAARTAFHTIVLDLPPSGLALGPSRVAPEPLTTTAGATLALVPSDHGSHRPTGEAVERHLPDPVRGLTHGGPPVEPSAEPLAGPPSADILTAAEVVAPTVAVGEADVLLMVARPESAGLTALETADAARAHAGLPAARAGMVVMGAAAAAPVASREVRARLGDRLWALVPSSAAELAAAAEDGLLLLDRPEVPAVQAMLALAHRVIPFTGAVGR